MAMLVENSDRMTEKSLETAKGLMKNMISDLVIDANNVHVAIANMYGSRFATVLPLSSSQSYQQALAAIDSIKFQGTPDTDIALHVNRSYDLLLSDAVGGRTSVPKTIVIYMAEGLTVRFPHLHVLTSD
jgi:hypothetical protein